METGGFARWISVWVLLLLVGLSPAGFAAGAPAPRLVVVIVVDGLGQEQVFRYRGLYTDGGFRMFLEKGAWYPQAEYGHAVTFTAVGHATLFTGAHPYLHGIISNEWYDRGTHKIVNCVGDPTRQRLGEAGEGVSPVNLKVSTLGDELRLATGSAAKVISISGKDRGAVLPGGKLGTAFFYSSQTGRFITSDYYMQSYPSWWQEFFSGSPQNQWFGSTWSPLLGGDAYSLSTDGDEAFRIDYRGMGRTFPHRLSAGEARPGPGYYSTLLRSPFANELMLAFAEAAIKGEALGQNPAGCPDLLALSFSDLDYVNHTLGPDSHESQDMMLRLDRILTRLFEFLDQSVGLNQTLVVLSSDHGFHSIPEAARMKGLEAGRIDPAKMADALNQHLSARFGEASWVVAWSAPLFYLNHEMAKRQGVTFGAVLEAAREFLLEQPGIQEVYRGDYLEAGQVPPTGAGLLASRSWHSQLSGDLFVVQKSGWYLLDLADDNAATHGSLYQYDRNVPLMFLGPWFQPGRYGNTAQVADLAPTLAYILQIRPPSASEGRVLTEILVR